MHFFRSSISYCASSLFFLSSFTYFFKAIISAFYSSLMASGSLKVDCFSLCTSDSVMSGLYLKTESGMFCSCLKRTILTQSQKPFVSSLGLLNKLINSSFHSGIFVLHSIVLNLEVMILMCDLFIDRGLDYVSTLRRLSKYLIQPCFRLAFL